jgi:hypothetical protein
MLLIVLLLVVCVAALLIRSARLARRMDPVALGWMSEQWLAEQRHARAV